MQAYQVRPAGSFSVNNCTAGGNRSHIMKNSVLCSILALVTALPAMARDDLNHWDFSDARKTADGKIIVQGSDGRNFSSSDPAITLVEDRKAPGRKALAFSGEQVKPPSLGPVYERPGPVKVKFSVNPKPDTGEPEQTILVHPGVYELRYNRKRGDLTAYFPQKDPQKFVSVRAPLTAGQWSEVELSAKDGKVTLTVDGKSVRMTFPGGASMQSTKAYARIGMMDYGRPFTGMLADLTIGDPAE